MHIHTLYEKFNLQCFKIHFDAEIRGCSSNKGRIIHLFTSFHSEYVYACICTYMCIYVCICMYVYVYHWH